MHMEQNTVEDRFNPQAILAGQGDSFDDNPPEWCDRCHAAGYDLGFRDGAASVRKSPLIVVNWSTLTGGIINIVAFGALLLLASWFGEMRGMRSDDRLNITFEKPAPEKASVAPIIRGTNGTTVVIKGDKQ